VTDTRSTRKQKKLPPRETAGPPDAFDMIIDTIDTKLRPSQLSTLDIPLRTLSKPGALTLQQKKHAQESFLAHYQQTANVSQSCKIAGITRATYYNWLHRDSTFATACEEADKIAQDVLLATAWKLAIEGVPRAVTSMGKFIYNPDGTLYTEPEYYPPVLLRLMSYKIPGFRESKDAAVTLNIDINGSRDSLLERLASSVREVVVDADPQEKRDTTTE